MVLAPSAARWPPPGARASLLHCGSNPSNGRLRKRRHVLRQAVEVYADAAAAGVALVGSVVVVKSVERLATTGVVEKKDARKLTHVLTGPGFMLTWPLFSYGELAPLVAASVPALNGLRLALAGLGATAEPGLIASVSRSTDKSELLRGPLIYVVVLVLVTLFGWRSELWGFCVMAMMCGGDGVADLVGRRLGTTKLPWNERKSWAGSIAMFSASLLMACGITAYFFWLGYSSWSPQDALPVIALTALSCTVVESLPVPWLDDNISVPLCAVAVCRAVEMMVTQ